MYSFNSMNVGYHSVANCGGFCRDHVKYSRVDFDANCSIVLDLVPVT